MSPPPGTRLLYFVGDRVRFCLKQPEGKTGCAFLRTTLGRGRIYQREIISFGGLGQPLKGSFWRDIPMRQNEGEWSLELPLTEVGFFSAKAYWSDASHRQTWPAGDDVSLCVHPDQYRTGNTIYCAFTRMFGGSKNLRSTQDAERELQLKQLDQQGYTVIPPSGKFRDLVREFPHIFRTLGCRILHLLPVHPTPTTMARFGRFGSPYATQDLTAVDPALVEFDKRTTGIDQFQELTFAAHQEGGRVFLDMVINHTGWGARLQETHPEWYVRHPDGDFLSPGAWGTIWEDLAELDPAHRDLWEEMASAFLVWCGRGVDGFRCDAGYKVPTPVWQYIIARVRLEYPETVFLLEGLGGPWDATVSLLTVGGMQWAYSELFQNHSGRQVADYLDYSIRQSESVGLYIHYSETHDNDRLAKRGREWSLLRNRLCALASSCGGFGFTSGVEWLANEKLEVHQSRGLSWGNPDNLLKDLAGLNQLLRDHPCFFDGAKLTRLSHPDSPVFALKRVSAEGKDSLLILVNTDPDGIQSVAISRDDFRAAGSPFVDLFGQALPLVQEGEGTHYRFILDAATVFVLTNHTTPQGLASHEYRHARALAAAALQAVSQVLSIEKIGPASWMELGELFERSPENFLSALGRMDPSTASEDLIAALETAMDGSDYPQVCTWRPADASRVFLVAPAHWLVLEDEVEFRVALEMPNGEPCHRSSLRVGERFVTFVSPQRPLESEESLLTLERYGAEAKTMQAAIRWLAAEPCLSAEPDLHGVSVAVPVSVKMLPTDLVLLTNGIGGMARLGVDLGRIQSKYDAVLAANLHPRVPVDRHVLVKRVRAWVNADGFLSPLDYAHLQEFHPGPPAYWSFMVDAGDARQVPIRLKADMLEGENSTVFQFERGQKNEEISLNLPERAVVNLIVRVDIEDRNFHSETRRNPGAEHHFRSHIHPLSKGAGFSFTPADDRHLQVRMDAGIYHPEEEWSHEIAHPVEASRGQVAFGDAFSPGWFEIDLESGQQVHLVMSAEKAIDWTLSATMPDQRVTEKRLLLRRSGLSSADSFGGQLLQAARVFLVRRDSGKTVIAGYPWFLDWGRDSLICARGYLAGGWVEEMAQLAAIFGRFVERGTMPNTIHGDDATNRDTVDAPLWFGMVCEELAAELGSKFYERQVGSRSMAEVLLEIAEGYLSGTPNGIRVDPETMLVWSPSHFTWMDTNFPAGTPRQGYPVEIQALWIRLMEQVARLAKGPEAARWKNRADQARSHLLDLFWLEDRGYFADLLIASPGQGALGATADSALRSNFLFLISLGLVSGEKAQRGVGAALDHLVVPGALRTLAPLPVTPPLPVYSPAGQLLNNPEKPYCGRYEGDEDTRRKPAYHNGTAWTWTFPVFCEALALAWNCSPEAVAAARGYLGSMEALLQTGCLGQLPEIVDGDFPHAQRGCDAQAWGATEALRVWKFLQSAKPKNPKRKN